jgi:hypothetical protein
MCVTCNFIVVNYLFQLLQIVVSGVHKLTVTPLPSAAGGSTSQCTDSNSICEASSQYFHQEVHSSERSLFRSATDLPEDSQHCGLNNQSQSPVPFHSVVINKTKLLQYACVYVYLLNNLFIEQCVVVGSFKTKNLKVHSIQATKGLKRV